MPSKLPTSIQQSNAIIIGAGPSGAYAAALFDAHGISVTILEKQSNFLSYNSSKSYALALFTRGQKALSRVPGLLEFMAPKGVHNERLCSHDIHPGKKGIVITNMGKALCTATFFLRYRLLHSFQQFLTTHCNKRVRLEYGSEVTDLRFKDTGDIVVSFRDAEGNIHEEISRFVIACDGRNSTVVNMLEKACKTNKAAAIESSSGFDRVVTRSASYGMCVKSLILNVDALQDYGISKTTVESSRLGLTGLQKGRKNQNFFSLGMFPQTMEDMNLRGGPLASVVGSANSSVWNLSKDDTETAYTLFEDNFPHVNVRELITESSMKEFIGNSHGSFPTLSRPSSLCASIGLSGAGGVAIIGDAAHSFPPDCGQGVNSGLEDVVTLMGVIKDADKGASVGQIVQQYEKVREKETIGLMKIAGNAFPYQYRQNRFMHSVGRFCILGKTLLAKRFPKLFYPSVLVMIMHDELSYSEIAKRADLTNQRLMIVCSLIPILLVLYYSHQSLY